MQDSNSPLLEYQSAALTAKLNEWDTFPYSPNYTVLPYLSILQISTLYNIIICNLLDWSMINL